MDFGYFVGFRKSTVFWTLRHFLVLSLSDIWDVLFSRKDIFGGFKALRFFGGFSRISRISGFSEI